MSELPRHHRSGEQVLPEVFADPGRNGFYYREKMPDSVMRYVPAAPLEAEIKRLRQKLLDHGISPDDVTLKESIRDVARGISNL